MSRKAAAGLSQRWNFEAGHGEISSHDCSLWSPRTPGRCATVSRKAPLGIGFHGVGARPVGVRRVGVAHFRHSHVPGGGW